ncbi:lipocalin-like domain-containing protein [Inmirania thermothiophila]|uniref:Putative secreted hydrolase n=1 Tax=Inmirania thermothiophila TaxID=1750597 RepID=A0A3N1Y5R1_9GAMM|nr:lipocalin-like domain-containing protein [Inmirania thermothiophila]ROR34143.1 putative secreted hydrolase [Inmirania thermothiophila]
MRAAAAAMLLLLAGCGAGPAPPGPPLRLDRLLAAPDAPGWAQVTGPVALAFPRDHGPHPAYRHEWWYLTGHLADDAGGRYGFQLTFFRFGLRPDGAAAGWRAAQAYMAHFALTDAGGGRFHAAERLARPAAGLAGASPRRVWVGPWWMEGDPDRVLRIGAADGPWGLALALRPLRPRVLHGRAGYSRKGPGAGQASIYYGYTRLAAEGRVRTPAGARTVRGTAWMDREWGSGALGPGQAGWDWFALQLEGEGELMYYRLRRRDGGTDPASAGTRVGPDGRVRPLAAQDVRLRVRGTWRSPRTGVRYPSGWTLALPAEGLELVLEPLLADQELDLSVRYWEGAVTVTGRRGGRPLRGRGYVELVGYGEEGG